MGNSKFRYIMVVEDSPEDFEVLERGFKKAEILLHFEHFVDSTKAWEHLQANFLNDNEPIKSPKPALILMDLNMPGIDGFELLKKIKSEPKLETIPVITLSTSKSENDINRAYTYGANTYISKPVDIAGYVRMANTLKTFWFECASLPTE